MAGQVDIEGRIQNEYFCFSHAGLIRSNAALSGKSGANDRCCPFQKSHLHKRGKALYILVIYRLCVFLQCALYNNPSWDPRHTISDEGINQHCAVQYDKLTPQVRS